MNQAIFSIAFAIILVWGFWQAFAFFKKLSRLHRGQEPLIEVSTPASPTPEPPLAAPRVQTNAIREFIRSRKASVAEAELYGLISREFADRVDAEQIIYAFNREDIASAAIAPAVFASQASIPDGARLIFSGYSPTPSEWLDILWPVATGDSIEAKAQAALAWVEMAEDVDWVAGDYGNAQPGEFVQPLVARGLLPTAAVRILHGASNLALGAILCDADLPRDTTAVAEMARELAVDFNDGGELTALCDDLNLDYAEIFSVLKAAGMDAFKALDAFNRGKSDSSSIDELAEELLPALVNAGYTNIEALVGLDDSDWDIDRSKLIGLAFDNDTSEEDVVRFLKEVDADPEEVEDQIREDETLDQKQRIELMYRWLHEEEVPVEAASM